MKLQEREVERESRGENEEERRRNRERHRWTESDGGTRADKWEERDNE